MQLTDYIASFPQATSITLVGPYYTETSLVEPIIFIDAGAKFQVSGKGFSVGDNDSFTGLLQEVLPADKDVSDLAYALRAISDRFIEIHLLGFLGGRKDHEMATMLEVWRYMMKSKRQGQVVWDHGKVRCISGEFVFNHVGTFSVFSFYDKTKVKLSGDVKYPISETIDAFSSHGLSNEAHGEFSVSTDQPIFIYFV